MEEVDKSVKETFPIVWNRLIKIYNPKTKIKPVGFVLGGQPGSGKSNLIQKAVNDCNDDIVVKNLASNIYKVSHSGYVDKLEIYKRFEENNVMKVKLVYSSETDIFYRSIIVDEILNGK